MMIRNQQRLKWYNYKINTTVNCLQLTFNTHLLLESNVLLCIEIRIECFQDRQNLTLKALQLHITLCDPIRQVTLRSCAMEYFH